MRPWPPYWLLWLSLLCLGLIAPVGGARAQSIGATDGAPRLSLDNLLADRAVAICGYSEQHEIQHGVGWCGPPTPILAFYAPTKSEASSGQFSGMLIYPDRSRWYGIRGWRDGNDIFFREVSCIVGNTSELGRVWRLTCDGSTSRLKGTFRDVGIADASGFDPHRPWPKVRDERYGPGSKGAPPPPKESIDTAVNFDIVAGHRSEYYLAEPSELAQTLARKPSYSGAARLPFEAVENKNRVRGTVQPERVETFTARFDLQPGDTLLTGTIDCTSAGLSGVTAELELRLARISTWVGYIRSPHIQRALDSDAEADEEVRILVTLTAHDGGRRLVGWWYPAYFKKGYSFGVPPRADRRGSLCQPLDLRIQE